MTEAPSSSTEATAASPAVITAPRYEDTDDHRPNRLHQVLAWVGIVAGVLFIVAAIFFSGVFFGRTSGGYHGWYRDHQGGQLGPDGSMDDCPMMRSGGMGPGGMGPGGMGPGGMGPGGMMGPGLPSPTTMPPFTQRPS